MEQPGMATLRRVLQTPGLRMHASSLQPISVLGQGGSGAVELCWHTHPVTGVRTKVATKRIRPEVLANPAMLQLLSQEIETLLSFEHRHAVKILGIGVDDGRDTLDVSDDAIKTKLFLVQEYLPGGSLRRLVSEMSLDWNAYGITTRVILSWLVQLANVLSALHNSSPPIVHRDVKLDNIMLTDSPKPSWSRAMSQSTAHSRDSAASSQDPSTRAGSVDSAVTSRPGQRSVMSRLDGIEIRVIDFGLARTLPRTKEVMQNKPLATPARSVHEQQWNDVLTPSVSGDSSAQQPAQRLPSRLGSTLSQLIGKRSPLSLTSPVRSSTAPREDMRTLLWRRKSATPASGAMPRAQQLQRHVSARAFMHDLHRLDQHSVRRSLDTGPQDSDCVLLEHLQGPRELLSEPAAAQPAEFDGFDVQSGSTARPGSTASGVECETQQRSILMSRAIVAPAGVPRSPFSGRAVAPGLRGKASPVHDRAPSMVSDEALACAGSSAGQIRTSAGQISSSAGQISSPMAPGSPAVTGTASLSNGLKERLSDVLHDLTGTTGSMMTMAPEVFKGQPYNHKADTFSFAIVAYELLHRRLILVSILERHFGASQRRKEAAVVEYAAAVSAGYRPPLHANMPASLKQLIESCWDANPLKRPPMAQVEAELRRILETENLCVMDSQAHSTGAPSCCSVM